MSFRARVFLSSTFVVTLTPILGLGACESSSPTSPTSFRRNQTGTATAPTPAPPQIPIANVSGTMWRHDAAGAMPAGHADFGGWMQFERSGSTLGRLQTDVSGHFRLTAPLGTRIYLTAYPSYQPCEAIVTIPAEGEVTRDIRIVSDHAQLGGRLPAELMASRPTLSGRVLTATPDGMRVVPGAYVWLDPLGIDLPTASTLTDEEGRYVLCGVDQGATTYLSVRKEGYGITGRRADVQGDTVIDIELTR